MVLKCLIWLRDFSSERNISGLAESRCCGSVSLEATTGDRTTLGSSWEQRLGGCGNPVVATPVGDGCGAG